MRRRLLKYVMPVFLLSFLFSVPKFFEADIGYKVTNTTDGASETVRNRQPKMRTGKRYGARLIV